jgi:hypothetical protein
LSNGAAAEDALPTLCILDAVIVGLLQDEKFFYTEVLRLEKTSL